MTAATDGPGEALSNLDRLARRQHVGTRTRAREHLLAAGRWTTIHRTLAVSAGVLAAVAGGSLLSGAEGPAPVAGVLALAAAVVSAFDAALGASTTVVEHKGAADRFTRVASSFVLFYDVHLLDASSYAEQVARYEAIMKMRDEAVATSPHPPTWARDAVRARRQEAAEAAGPRGERSTPAREPSDQAAAVPRSQSSTIPD